MGRGEEVRGINKGNGYTYRNKSHLFGKVLLGMVESLLQKMTGSIVENDRFGK